MQIINKTRALASAIGTGALVLASQAHAALPAAVETEVEAYKDDALAAIGLIMAAGVAIWGLKKLGRKLGWL